MSKLVSCVSVLTLAIAAVTVPQPAAARSFGARGGASAFSSQAGCFAPNGPMMTNSSCGATYWTVPLLLDGTIFAALNGTVTVTAQGPDASRNVGCRAQGFDKLGRIVSDTGFIWLSTFGGPRDIALTGVVVPAGGTAVVDCLVGQGASVITVNW